MESSMNTLVILSWATLVYLAIKGWDPDPSADSEEMGPPTSMA